MVVDLMSFQQFFLFENRVEKLSCIAELHDNPFDSDAVRSVSLDFQRLLFESVTDSNGSIAPVRTRAIGQQQLFYYLISYKFMEESQITETVKRFNTSAAEREAAWV
ncbi:hypothetical protein RCH09_001700 [Actimicrobium sp. GrIS 1.19]|uniref:hypothetical protein n=1 Tax=Actimicrobium sp. GrIS 1.19 TaxID=3071708 RepID=UPI002E031C75|nr:hypothetical protein [Actimicrobium sp. GrIS 1.19]